MYVCVGWWLWMWNYSSLLIFWQVWWASIGRFSLQTCNGDTWRNTFQMSGSWICSIQQRCFGKICILKIVWLVCISPSTWFSFWFPKSYLRNSLLIALVGSLTRSIIQLDKILTRKTWSECLIFMDSRASRQTGAYAGNQFSKNKRLTWHVSNFRKQCIFFISYSLVLSKNIRIFCYGREVKSLKCMFLLAALNNFASIWPMRNFSSTLMRFVWILISLLIAAFLVLIHDPLPLDSTS